MNLFVSCWRAHPHEANGLLLCNSSFAFLLGQKATNKRKGYFKVIVIFVSWGWRNWPVPGPSELNGYLGKEINPMSYKSKLYFI